ncbi:MAG: iron ABC transporter permease [Rhodocyclaceae bacterium]|nr:iron ABC transporter permease [Rhodocyclaceae bacterium]MCA3032504.1 iron ABC transporter permease [Rhodocyclaceae bacterium]MCA3035868.1 iron ABC transporter permease [Rhodocyclaceae bacterium]MCA3040504.1 iron ABC transporter permease [Rhodocyclaceae bacterium]MCA3047373.1 iron ABC transporter permease [Rhodocyclaceae bacterium]
MRFCPPIAPHRITGAFITIRPQQLNSTTPSQAIPIPAPTNRRGNFWFAVTLAVALLLPLASVLTSVFQADQGAWQHMRATTLADLLGNSILLLSLVGIGAASIGTGTAWLTARYNWWGRRTLEWMLVLPLAMPAYVMAYTYTDLLQYAGPVQSVLRETFGWTTKSDYWFFDIRTVGGAATMLTCALYPYVYLLARVAFLERSTSFIEVGRTFGYGRWSMLFRVTLPLARPAIVAGIALVMMETLADYGTVSYFGVNTFTTGIFNAWFAQGDRIAAAKLASMLLGFVAIVLFIESHARRRVRFADALSRPAQRTQLQGHAAVAAFAACSLPLVAGFLLPAMLLVRLAVGELTSAEGNTNDAFVTLFNPGDFAQLAWNSFSIAILTAAIAVVLGLLLAYANRRSPSMVIAVANRAVGLGYAIPGTVIAVGVLIPVTALDHRLADAIGTLLGRDVGLILTGGFAVLVYAYLIRFLAISLQTCEAGFAKITPSMDAAARSLGASDREVVRRVHMPLLRTSLITAGLMVFVDVMKELPATLVMRPFNFDTLAVRTYTLAKDERLAEASIAALAIVLVGLIPVVVASRAITRPTGNEPR